MYYNPMPSMQTPVRAWVETAKSLLEAPKFHLGGVFVHVENPLLFTDSERGVIYFVDRFLRRHGQWPVSTVANTIFPKALHRGGAIRRIPDRSDGQPFHVASPASIRSYSR